MEAGLVQHFQMNYQFSVITEQELDRLSRQREALSEEVGHFGLQHLVLAFGAWLAGLAVSIACLVWEWGGYGENVRGFS